MNDFDNGLYELEESLWKAETRFDRELMDKVFADDFFEFGRSGRVYDREELLSATGDKIDIRLPLENFKVRELSPDLVQTTYNSIVTYEEKVQYGRRSSIWSRKGDSWELRFHQGTPYQPEEL